MTSNIKAKLAQFTDKQLSDLQLECSAQVRKGGDERHQLLLRLLIEESASRAEVAILQAACFSCGIDPQAVSE